MRRQAWDTQVDSEFAADEYANESSLDKCAIQRLLLLGKGS
jgi:hypothetical protein